MTLPIPISNSPQLQQILPSGKALLIDARSPDAATIGLLKALANETRLEILEYLGDRVVALSQVAQDLDLPASTAAMHIGILERAGLLHTELQPASRGLQKVCARTYDELVIDLPRGTHHTRDRVEIHMPIGAYTAFETVPTCGLASATGLIGYLDDPHAFYEPDRIHAQLLWFHSGFVEYVFPNRVPPGAKLIAAQLTAEVASEAPLHDADWPSDISVWINDVHLGEWTSPGDYGGTRGRLTPRWWEDDNSQFGVLKRWHVTKDGTAIDGVPLSGVTTASLGVKPRQPIRVRLGVRPDAANVGGLNLFGRRFGHYPQDLVMRLEYTTELRVGSDGDERTDLVPEATDPG
ncbi:MAG TPA: helix-turn-helix domain-containing protein [Candidatus Limnocylindrales bacterium]|nr:helix-turn-helix domain-containing protein [Candidatus Limnocylindrales bacterium]